MTTDQVISALAILLPLGGMIAAQWITLGNRLTRLEGRLDYEVNGKIQRHELEYYHDRNSSVRAPGAGGQS